jgi:DNA-binding NarL/FixJ family response regulator
METTYIPSETASLNRMSKQALDHRIRILVVDELGLFRASLAHLLASEPDFEVVGECGTATEALGLLEDSKPDVILLDFEVGTERGTDFMSAAREANYQGNFLIVAGAPDVMKSALSLRVGASGIFLKSGLAERLLRAIKVVSDGGVWVDPKIIQLLADQLIDQCPAFGEGGRERRGTLPDERERDVLAGIVGGLSNRRIGDSLGLSESQVKNVIQRLFTKSGVRTRSQLVRAALEARACPTGVHQKMRTGESGCCAKR